MRFALTAAAAALAGLAACTPARAPWTAPGVAQSTIDADWANCQRTARVQAGATVEPAGADQRRFDNPLEVDSRRRDAVEVQRSVAACMQAKGYAPAR